MLLNMVYCLDAGNFLNPNTINELLILIFSVIIELKQLQTLKLNDGAVNFHMMFGNKRHNGLTTNQKKHLLPVAQK